MVLTAYVLDMIFGDSSWIVKKIGHPVIFIGKIIEELENKLLNLSDNSKKQRFKGVILAMLSIFLVSILCFAVIYVTRKINYFLGLFVEILICYQLLATKSLKIHSIQVVNGENLEEKRKFLSYIVGRDTKNLTEEQIYCATVETIAENTTDGVVAPMFYMMFGGAVLGIIYKSINTLDSMIGYFNERYRYFGAFSAKLDDVVNFIPARISAIFMIFSAFLLGYDGKNAFKIWIRDRKNHKSPNSAQTESVCAGALNIMLGGDSSYGGEMVKKQTIGDNKSKINAIYVKKANNLMYMTSLVSVLFFSAVKLIIRWWVI